MSYDVAVPRSLPPKFPDRCVLCGADEPGRQVRFSAGAKYGAFFFLSWFGKGKGSILAPACGSCAVSAMSRALLRFALSAGAAALVGWYLFAGMKGGGRGLFKLKAVGVFFAAVVPPVIWDWLFPARFSVTFDDKNQQAVCHFLDPIHAAQFSALNHLETADELEQPDDSMPVGQPTPRPQELPANFKPAPTSSSSLSSASNYRGADSYEDKTNPFRNLEDPRFRR